MHKPDQVKRALCSIGPRARLFILHESNHLSLSSSAKRSELVETLGNRDIENKPGWESAREPVVLDVWLTKESVRIGID